MVLKEDYCYYKQYMLLVYGEAKDQLFYFPTSFIITPIDLDKGCCRLHRSLTSSVMDGSLSRRLFLGESPGVC
jgi:hypothetical protein